MGITKKGGHYLTCLYLNMSELKVKIFIKYSISVPNKLMETRKLLVTLFVAKFIPLPGVPKKVHRIKIIYLCSENRQITKLYVIC